MSSLARRVVSLSAALLVGTALGASDAAPAPPSDAELTKFIAVQNGLTPDAARAGLCDALRQEEDDGRERSLAELGREVEAHAVLGPLVRRHGLGGQRFLELSVQVGAGLIALAMADEADATLRAQKKAAETRARVLAESAEARAVAPRQAELVAALERYEQVCGGDDEEPEEEDEAPPEDEGLEDGGARRR
jgi:hypothetical protein